VVWLHCTATLNMKSFESLCYSSGFSQNVRIMRTTINRPEITIIRKELPQNTKSSFRSLYFLFDEAADLQDDKPSKPTPERIKKSVIFFDNKSDIRSCLDLLRSWLVEKKGYTGKEAMATICEYHATLSEGAKERLYGEFKKPDSKIRILVATDALSLGCDVPDIEIIVQYGLPRRWNMSTVLQRFAGCPSHWNQGVGYFFRGNPVGSLAQKRTARGEAGISILRSPISQTMSRKCLKTDTIDARQIPKSKFVRNYQMLCMNSVTVTAVYGV
jgi:helicase-like protein